MKEKILVTSALPYVNNVPHLGNLIGAALSADVFARYCRLAGKETLFVFGTDEHGTTTEFQALKEGISPKELTDRYVAIHKGIYEWFQISEDCWGRSISKENKEITQDIFLKLYKNGFIVEHEIEQLYSEKDKKFLSDRFVEGECPHCHYEKARGDQCDKCSRLLDQKDLINPKSRLSGDTPVLKKTKHLYIDLLKFQKDLEKLFEKNSKEGFWTPIAKNITKSWLKEGLKERCITRDLEWGIPVPLRGWEGKVFYSWFDAPIEYIGSTIECLPNKWKNWWQNEDVKLYQFMGKDNVVFHSILFPAFLIGTKDPYVLVYHLNSTEYLNYEKKKFSKSQGVGVYGDDAKNSGIESDVWRYYLVMVRPEKSDTEFLWGDFEARTNNDLVANFGNYVNRTLNLVAQKAYSGKKTKRTKKFKVEKDAKKLFDEFIEILEKAGLHKGLQKANEISALGNQFLQEQEPWKKESKEAQEIISQALDLCKVLALVYSPFVPAASEKLWKLLGLKGKPDSYSNAFKEIPVGTKIGKPEILFKKLEHKTVEELKKKFG